MNHARLLITHPDPSASGLLAALLRASGFEAEEVAEPDAAARMLGRGISLLLAAPTALGPFSLARRAHPEIPLVLLIDGISTGRAAEARRLGAAGILKLPSTAAALRATVIQVLGSDATPPTALRRPRPAAASPAAAEAPRPPMPEPVRPPRPRPPRFSTLKEALREPERRFILRTLEALCWNRQETARVLGIDRTTLHKKMRHHGLLGGGQASAAGGRPPPGDGP